MTNWTPVLTTEDLPTEWGRYLATLEFEPEYDADPDVEIVFLTKGGEWLWDDNRMSLGGAKILAWMSLPVVWNESDATELQRENP